MGTASFNKSEISTCRAHTHEVDYFHLRSEDRAIDFLARQEFSIVHFLSGRMRLRPRYHPGAAAGVEAALASLTRLLDGTDITVSPRTGSLLIYYEADCLANICRVFSLGWQDLGIPAFAASTDAGLQPCGLRLARATDRGRALVGSDSDEEAAVVNPIPRRIANLFMPGFVTGIISAFRALPYIFTGFRQLLRGRLNLEVLDGAALMVCLVRRDFRSLGSIIFFFALGEYLADWTRKKSRAKLADSLALNIDQVWVRGEGGVEYQIPHAQVRPGDAVVVRAGSILPVDGNVLSGEGMVNQSSMTGESLPVHRAKGAFVHAGTVLEEGELLVEAVKVGSDTRIHAILNIIERSESVKASIQGRYERLADSIVPYNFLLSGAVYAATGDTMRAGSVLLVDYSCAIRLATPLTMFTAMREAAEHGVLIKGGKFMEAVAEADVIVFDKTGTLTEAKPVLAGVIPFGKRARSTVLRLAACLEEHFPHPMGQAVVRAAEAEHLRHREEHTKVDFLVAHGIASTWRGQRVLIGSGHFVLEDEKIAITPEQEQIARAEAAKGHSLIYLAIGGELAGILLIEDKIREETPVVVEALRRDGIKRVIMLTGDCELTAASIAARAGLDEFRARMLPEEKAAFVESLRNEGRKIIMVGDGINDSPALSAADVGVAMAGGADMAREVADIVLMNERLEGLLIAREISRLALGRVRKNFHTSLIWNSIFLMGGLMGILNPGLSAFLHNASTSAIAVHSIQPLLPVMGGYEETEE